MNVKTKKIENASIYDIEELMKNMNKGIIFYTKARFGTIDVLFKNEETAKSKVTLERKSKKWILYPMYMGHKITKIRIGGILLEMKPEWMVATLHRT